MNGLEVDEAAYLLFQKVKIAVATVIIKSSPENLDVKHYAAMFQDKFRKKAGRVNLYLEKKLFHEQLLLLLPAFRISSPHVGDFCEPMDVDVEEDVAHPASVAAKLYSWTNEKDKFYTSSINSLAQFLDAIMKAELLSNSAEMITRNDVIELLLTCEESSLSLAPNASGYQQFTSISSNLLKYIMKSANVIKITSECVSTIVDLARKFLTTFNTKFVNRESVLAVRHANQVLFQYTKNFSKNELSNSYIFEFVKYSTRDFFEQSSSQSTCHCWYIMFGCWKQNESSCAAAINPLFGVLRKFSETNALYSQLPVEQNCEHILEILKRMLNSYAKLCCPQAASLPPINGPRETDDYRSGNLAMLRKSDISRWEKMLRDVLLECILKKRPIVRSSWTCLKIIMLMKCQFSGKSHKALCSKNGT